jgi:hypothetical protein
MGRTELVVGITVGNWKLGGVPEAESGNERWYVIIVLLNQN